MTMEQARTYDARDSLTAQTEEAKAAAGNVFDGRADPEVMEIQAQRIIDAQKSNLRAFVFPQHQQFRQLVVPGKEPSFELQARDPGRFSRRVGDIWLEATGGIAILDPAQEGFEARVAWCEEHTNICRDAFLPETVIWASMKTAQQDTMYRDATMPKSIDVDAVLRGDMSQLSAEDSLVARAQQQLVARASSARS